MSNEKSGSSNGPGGDVGEVSGVGFPRPYPGGRKTPLCHVRTQLGHSRRASGEWRLPRERWPVNRTAGLMLLLRDAAGQSGLTRSPPQTHKRTHPSPEEAVPQSRPGEMDKSNGGEVS